MESNGLTASDIALMCNNGGMGGNGSWIWIIAFVFMFFLVGGRGGCNPVIPNNVATTTDVQEGFNFAALERQNNETIQEIQRNASYLNSNMKDGNYGLLGEIRDLQMSTERGFTGVQKTETEILRAIDKVNYDSAMRDCEIKNLIRDENNATRLMMKDDKIDALQQKVNYLELTNVVGQATAGMVRYPNSMAYDAGTSPFCNCSNRCCG